MNAYPRKCSPDVGLWQAWCFLQVKLCDPCLSTLKWFVCHADAIQVLWFNFNFINDVRDLCHRDDGGLCHCLLLDMYLWLPQAVSSAGQTTNTDLTGSIPTQPSQVGMDLSHWCMLVNSILQYIVFYYSKLLACFGLPVEHAFRFYWFGTEISLLFGFLWGVIVCDGILQGRLQVMSSSYHRTVDTLSPVIFCDATS